MIYLYAIADRLADLPEIEGIDDVPVARRACEGLDLALSEHEAAVDTTEEAVLAHARVVEALVPLTEALLPARFGVAFNDVQALETALGERADELRESLERVRGRVELGVRVVGEERREATTASTGRAYLEARRATSAEADRLEGELHDALARRVRAARVSKQSGGRLVLSGAYLVEPDGIPAFQDAIHSLETEHPHLTFALTGPWPAYSFTGVET